MMMRRKVLNLAAILSLILWLVTAFFWATGCTYKEEWNRLGTLQQAPMRLKFGFEERRVVWGREDTFLESDIQSILNSLNGSLRNLHEPVLSRADIELLHDNGESIDGAIFYVNFGSIFFSGYSPTEMFWRPRIPVGSWATITVSMWVPFIAFGILPAIVAKKHVRPALARIRKLRTRRTGVCAQCAYNLTGNTSGICPECGSAVLKSAGRTA